MWIDSRPAMRGASEQVLAWEGAARAVHDETGVSAPVDAFQLARAVGLVCMPGPRGTAALDGDLVRYDASARPVRQHGLIAHEVAHRVLQLHGEADTEPAANYTAGALMLPRARFDRDLRRTWDLRELRAAHPNASAEMIARRITQVRDAVVTVLDQGRLRARVASPWAGAPSARLTPLERELADAALASGDVKRESEMLAAYPFFDGEHRRVIVIADAQQLGLRF